MELNKLITMRLSLAITTYNRPELTIECIKNIVSDNRIDEIIIADDKSSDDNYFKLLELLLHIKSSKITLCRNEENIGMMKNKINVVSKCLNNWVILFDSDNILDSSYLDALEKEYPLKEDTIYCPDFAKPEFSFTNYSGLMYNAKTIKNYLHYRDFRPHLNCCNYVVPKQNFLDSFNPNNDILESDTIWIAYNWLKNKYSFKIVPYMRYFHRVGENSAWLKHADINMRHSDEIIEKIKEL